MTDERFKLAPSVKSRRLNVLPENPDEEACGRFPKWLHRKMPEGRLLWNTHEAVDTLPTVCEEAKCPNLLECWSKKTATFLAMGKECTRNCGFCDIDFNASPKAPDPEEPKQIAESAKKLGLRHVVVTMVARDDLPDKGASHIAKIIEEVKKEATIEVLTSDFSGDDAALQMVLDVKPEIFNHNIETVESLTGRVRHKATYTRTLEILKLASASNSLVKSGLMVGLGESEDEVKKTLQDLKEVGCQIVTIGQYLQPNRRKLRVKSFVTPKQFNQFAAYGREIGIPYVYSGPFVRSSYNAAEIFEALNNGSGNI
ncbi:MAG: Lipoyl synthase 2 [Chlamydiales bacterium]|nr:Lipoyl synthase 2 [Chlamydiales bacterium]MCH9636275.1 Lipoyl synthase 2 [Chlamydiales bacterium]MCH9704063.1 lipoyl synthase [Chlamydiota bacterium]